MQKKVPSWDGPGDGWESCGYVLCVRMSPTLSNFTVNLLLSNSYALYLLKSEFMLFF